jgi:beta-glucosidase/6-phospho-beta-glucosidase/beta-galactosidase
MHLPQTSSHPDQPVRQPEPSPYRSFWMGGFEGADHLNSHGRPLDMVRATGHLDHLEMDYARLAAWGLRSVRESVGWRMSERDGHFDFSRAVRTAQAARRHGVQVLWTLMHYGTPPDVSLLDDAFCERFARFAAEAAKALAPYADEAPIYTPINEISFLAWAVSQTRMMHPYGIDAESSHGATLTDGFQIKCRLVEAALMGMKAVREVVPHARFLHVEPLVHVVPPADRPDLIGLAEEVRGYQWQTWDLISGRLEPGLGGHPEALDLIGVNHYHNGQWEVLTERRLHWHLNDPRRKPFSQMLGECWRRYRRPIMIAETSHVGVGRAEWLHQMAGEVAQAIDQGIPVQGLCLYPIVDRPDWDDAQHWHHSGLWDHHATDGADFPLWPRQLNLPYAKKLRRWRQQWPATL